MVAVTTTPLTAAAERIRRAATEQLALLDEVVRSLEIRPGDPMEPVIAANRSLIAWMPDVADDLARSAQPMSPEAERLLAERVGTMAGAVQKAEAWRFARSSVMRAVMGASGVLAALILAAFGGGYWLGVRGSVVTLQNGRGEIASVCKGDAIQQAPDGTGRICAVWVRLDQAGVLGAGH